jgi:heme oxygenase
VCAATSSIVERLRRETRAVHERLEATIPLLSPLATESTYTTYLAALLGFHRPIERQLNRITALHQLPLDLSHRWKSAHLAFDLHRLMTTDELAALPACRALPAVAAVPHALGCLYVLEGATLGGRVIFRHLAERFPALIASSSSYLQIYGTSTGPRWQQFCGVLASRPDEEHDSIVDTAARTFEAFADWVDGYAVPRWRAEGLAA